MIIRNKVHPTILIVLFSLLALSCSSVESKTIEFASITESVRDETFDLHLRIPYVNRLRNNALLNVGIDGVTDEDDDNIPSGAPTQVQVAEEEVPQPTNHPTHEPTVRPTRSPTHSPTQKPTAFPTSSPTTEDWKNKVQDEEEEIVKIVRNKTAEILAAFLVFFGFAGMVLTAYCTMNFPDGICASCCQLIFSLLKLLSKIICLPCDLIRYRGYTSSEAADRSMFLERAEGHTSDLELI